MGTMGLTMMETRLQLLLSLSLALLSLTSGSGVGEEFQRFKAKHGKSYSSAKEESHRFQVFQSNLRKISEHNSQPGVSWRMAVTEFADLTAQEFTDTVLGGYIRTPQTGYTGSGVRSDVADLPESVDWREAGVITDPKNQGSCGSCWAFATTSQIESYAAINNVSLTKLSAQEVTTCTPNPSHCGGTGGCRGSVPQLGYNYVQLFGLTTADEYPYWSGTTGMTGSCKYDLERRTPLVSITGYNTIPANDIEATMTHLANVGPLAVAADASPWQLYGSGVFSGCSYSSNIGINHAIQMVGYGTDPSKGDYWLVRNSWGSMWGEHGYIRLQRESELTCGVDSTPMDGTACVGGPGTDQQNVCGMCGILFDMSYPLGAHAFDQA